MAEDERKAELTGQLARSRNQITANVRSLSHDLDFVSRARRAFKTHPAVWIGGAVLIGLLVARLPFGRKKVTVKVGRKAEPTAQKAEKAGLLMMSLKFAFDILKPTLMGWATRYIADHFERSNRFNTGPR